MKKNSSGEVSISASEIQALRLNKLEYHRLQRNINILHDDLQVQLGRLQRQAQGLKYHYANVVRVVKPNQPYQLWKQAHAYEIAQDYTKNWIGLMISILIKSGEYRFFRSDLSSFFFKISPR
jgi:hypothetical protein